MKSLKKYSIQIQDNTTICFNQFGHKTENVFLFYRNCEAAILLYNVFFI